MARRRKKKQKRGFSEQVTLVLAGSALTLCALSVMYGFLIRKSVAEHNLQELRIEILNGTGEKGVARGAAMVLMKKGVDVFSYGNAADFSYEESILIARKKNDNIGALGRALGCDNIIEQYTDNSLVDATLIIGADYEKLNLRE